MKIIYTNLKYLLTFLLYLSLFSCDTNDYSLLLNDNEQNSLGEIQSLEIYSGINRVVVKGWVDDPNVSEVNIYWDDKSESLVVPVNASNGADTINEEIGDLEEKLYTFEVQTSDDAGNTSKSVVAGAKVFGSDFSSSLDNRELSSNLLLDSDLDLTYGPVNSSSGIIGTEVVYENTSGENVEVFLNSEQSSLSISDFKSGSAFSYRSVYIPSPMSLDTLYTEYDEFTPVELSQIAFVTDDSSDDEQIEWLREQGFYVTIYYNSGFGSASQDDIDMLNSKDLIIIGRSGNSGDFAGEEKIAWNSLTVPLILNTQWAARSSRLNWFDHSDGPVKVADIGAVRVQVQEPGDPAFEGVTMERDNLLPWSNTPDDFLYINPGSNANLLAVTPPGEAEREEGGAVLFARFDTGVEFYPGAGESAAGPRTYFGFGSDADDGNSYYFPLTEEAKQVYLNEINRLVEE